MADTSHIRNFSIIAHIDHGKSTLADRMLEVTATIEKRNMRDQVLDQMDLERERGITIKMQPARMKHAVDGVEYVLNLIDTPGHIDFAYEVSRALTAVEGVLLLVDATQGVQAQTFSTLALAQELDRVVIPVISKVDSQLARSEEVKGEMAKLLNREESAIVETSGKTGEGVPELLARITRDVPPPSRAKRDELQSLVFDFAYSDHRGVIVYVRLMGGSVRKGDTLMFKASGEKFNALEVGVFSPDMNEVDKVSEGEIGYIVTGVKRPGVASVGDTIVGAKRATEALAGYQSPRPVVWASVYPESQDDFTELKQSLERLRLSDSSLSFEEEASGALGRGFRCGFLGMLHLEIVTERLRREFNLTLIVTTPSITYEVQKRGGTAEIVYTPSKFPEHGDVEAVQEPWVSVDLIAPGEYVSVLTQLLFEHEGIAGATENFKDGRMLLKAEMPLRELMRSFFDRLKSATSGYASLSYEIEERRPADVTRLDVLVAEELVPAFSRIVSRRRVEDEAKALVERLHGILPRQLFATKIQAKALGRIISSKTLPALKKDVTGHLYGGDITRKRKLWEKQKKGKKRLLEWGKVAIPQDVFLKMMRRDHQ